MAGFFQGPGSTSNPFLGRKYDLMFQEAQNQRELNQAQERSINTQTALAPAESAARNAAAEGQANQATGLGQYYRTLGAGEPGKAQTQSLLGTAQTGQIYSQINPNAAATDALRQLVGNNGGFNSSVIGGNQTGRGYAMGASYVDGENTVPGKGDGTVDTVPAMLAPGEAVLNKGAADHVGRHFIEALNTIGKMKMGSGLPQPPENSQTLDNRVTVQGGEKGSKGTAKKADNPVSMQPQTAGTTQGYAEGATIVGGKPGIGAMPGQGGSWTGPVPGPTPPPSTGSNLRANLGIGVPRPQPIGYADGVSMVPPHYSYGTSDSGRQGYASGGMVDASGGDVISDWRAQAGDRSVDSVGQPTTIRNIHGYDAGTSSIPSANYVQGTAQKSGGEGDNIRGYAMGGTIPPAKGPKIPQGAGKGTPPTNPKEAKGKSKGGETEVHVKHKGPGMTPEMMNAILSMGNHGMPGSGPGGSAPMPLNMPMVGQTPMQQGGGATRLPTQGGGQ